MKIRTSVFVMMMLLIIALVLPAQAWACACCADDGEYGISFSRPSAYQLGLLRRIRFSETANLFTNAAGFEAVRGLVNPKESYALNGSFAGSLWNLVFRDGKLPGTLNLRLPARMLSYRADIHDQQKGGAGGPLLYKEWRFEGQVNGAGFFQRGFAAPAKYFLVLQGRGNNCDNAEDFTHWRLEITGRKAAYAFFGELAKPGPDSSAR
ncbi:MAG TPA: hypothetical protein VJ124_13050 [Pyrinomonadaceae bacterium]|nr:hypothetical protein [Pyrinomonadaceae bacterium]